MPKPTKLSTLLASATMIGIAITACASGGEPSSGGDDTTPVTGTSAEAAAGLPPGAAGLEGRWAHFDVVAYEDDLMNTMIISTGFSDLEMRDGVLWNTQRFCHADMANDQGIDVSISDQATSAIVPVDTPVEVALEDGSFRVVRPATPTPIGIDLEDPANESLPADPDDPRITDDDGDGKPGVTATIGVADGVDGELYIARREIFAYDVTQESPDRMVGFITDDSEQLVLGASDEVFNLQTDWVQHPDPARNPVIWQRVDETWDCERLAAERDDLFPPNPPVDY